MKFDVFIGNPPYNKLDGGAGVSAVAIYPHFVDAAKKSNPRYISMIMPAKWYNGGRGLDEFREAMLHDKQVRTLFDYVDTHDCFPSVDVAGGVCHFLRDRAYDGLCDFVSCRANSKQTTTRNLGESEVLIRHQQELSIISKIQKENTTYLNSIAYSQKPFGLRTYVKPLEEGDIKLRYNAGIGPYKSELVNVNKELIYKWKIITSRLTGEHAGETDKNGQKKIFSVLEILEPGTICTETYMLLSAFDNKDECVNMFQYLKTRFVRALIAMATSTQQMSRANFRFVPIQDFSRPWTENDLYEKYKLTDPDIKFIETMIKPME
jgi:site-specific DNA-methyltransferase (adenine-specific)